MTQIQLIVLYINSIINANNSSAVYTSQAPFSSFVWGLNSADSSFQLCLGLLLNTGTFMKIDNSSNINLIGNSLNLSTGTFLFPSATGTNLSASSYFFTQTGTEFVAGLNPSASNNFQLMCILFTRYKYSYSIKFKWSK